MVQEIKKKKKVACSSRVLHEAQEPDISGAESSVVSSRMVYAQVLRDPSGGEWQGLGYSERPLEGIFCAAF